MIFFSRKIKLRDSTLFKGAIDAHSHILPSVDDGVQSMEESIQALEYFATLGIKRAILTPHVNLMTEGDGGVMEAFERLKSCNRSGVELHLAAEYMIDTAFEERVERDEMRCLNGRSILVETSYVAAPNNFENMLYELSSRGDLPVIAHPERYSYMRRCDYHEIKNRGYDMQLNILSLAGYYGARVEENARYMLERGMYSYFGSDLHALESFRSCVEGMSLTTKHIDALESIKASNLELGL